MISQTKLSIPSPSPPCTLHSGPQDLYTNGWRISLAVAGGPAIILFIGSLLLPESPNHLVEM